MAFSYEYSVGSVRAKETALLTKQNIEQLLTAKNEAAVCAYLRDKGYNGDSFDKMLENKTASTWDYLFSVSPDRSVFTPFLLQNDLHNIKAAIKGTLAGANVEHLMLTPSVYEPSQVKEAVENHKFDLFEEWLRSSCEQAYDAMAHDGDARLGDAYLDAALEKTWLADCKKYKNEIIENYFVCSVFYNNVKIALRAARSKADRLYLSAALCDVDGLDRKDLVAAILKGEQAVVDLLSGNSHFDCSAAVEQYRQSPTAFEKFVDDMLVGYACRCKYESEGAAPMVGYLLGVQAEIKALQIIVSGIRTEKSADATRERLRKIYG